MLSLPSVPDGTRARSRRRIATALVAIPLVLAACSSGATASPSAAGSTSPSAGASGSAGASAGATDQATALLAKTIPTQVGDTPLTVMSGVLTDLQGDLPNYAELVQRLSNASIQPGDVRAAVGKPTAGGVDPTVGGLLITSMTPGGLGLLGLMQQWIASTPGATATQTNLGKPVTKVTFTDGSLPLYYYLFDTTKTGNADTLYFVRTASDTTAEQALTQLP